MDEAVGRAAESPSLLAMSETYVDFACRSLLILDAFPVQLQPDV